MGSIARSCAREFRRGQPDLEGAFNDGYELASESTGVAVGRWVLIGWSVAAWFVGSFIMTESLVGGISRLLR